MGNELAGGKACATESVSRSARLTEDGLALLREGESASFDLSPDWYDLLAEVGLPPNLESHFEQLAPQGRIVGVLPLKLARTLRSCHAAESLSTFYTGLYRPAIAAGVTADDLAGALRELVANRKLPGIRLDRMDPQHPSFLLLEAALRKAGLQVHRYYCFGNWYYPVGGNDYPSYLAARPSALRNTIHRRGRKFEENGRGRFELVSDGDVTAASALWEHIYAASWKTPEPFPEFMPGLIRLCARRGWLRMGIAYYDGLPVAAQIWIVNQGRASIYKLAYDEAQARHSAGTLLTAFLMRHVIDVDGVQEVDYLIGDEPYKRDWMTHRRERWGLVAYNPRTLVGRLGGWRESLGRGMKRWLNGGRDDEGRAGQRG